MATDARENKCYNVFIYFRTLFTCQRSGTGISESLRYASQQPHPRALRPAPGAETTVPIAAETATLIS